MKICHLKNNIKSKGSQANNCKFTEIIEKEETFAKLLYGNQTASPQWLP